MDVPSSPTSFDGFNADPIDMDIDMDIEHPQPDVSPSHITRVFHPKLNGMLNLFLNIYSMT